MKILVACEESQAVTTELRRLGHEAYSNDIIECSGGHPEWHIRWDALSLINGNCTFLTEDGEIHRIDGKWDILIAFPPCTHLAVSGARHFEKKREDGRQREGIEFFCQFLNADCDRIAVENPVGIIGGDYITQYFPDLAEKYGLPKKPSQIVQPYEYGHPNKKTTCLWLKDLPHLIPTEIISPEPDFVYPNGKKYPNWMMETLKKCKTPEERSTARSKTFPGIAKAMAEQWAGQNSEVENDSV
jgi:site-specific DNA-cytosine methylase